MLVLRLLPCVLSVIHPVGLCRACVSAWSCTIKYTPCTESAPFASDGRLTLKTSVGTGFEEIQALFIVRYFVAFAFFAWSRTFLYAPCAKSAGFASRTRLTLQTSVGSCFEKTRALFIARYFVAFAFLLSLPASPYGKGRCHGVTEGIRVNPQKGRHLLCTFCHYEMRSMSRKGRELCPIGAKREGKTAI